MGYCNFRWTTFLEFNNLKTLIFNVTFSEITSLFSKLYDSENSKAKFFPSLTIFNSQTYSSRSGLTGSESTVGVLEFMQIRYIIIMQPFFSFYKSIYSRFIVRFEHILSRLKKTNGIVVTFDKMA